MSSPDWQLVHLRDITLKAKTWNPLAEPRDSLRYVDVSAVSRDTLEITGTAEFLGPAAPSRARKIIKSEDVIFATIRPKLKRIARVPKSYDNELASTAFCVLRPNPELVDPGFLYFAIGNDSFVEE